MRRTLALAAVWLGLVAATPRPFLPPTPDLAPLVPFVAAPLDKPPVLADAPLPPAPAELPALPLAALSVPQGDKPVAFVQPPRTLPCIGAWLGVASESLECGRARFLRAEYEDAAKALESAARPSSDREILREARYWLGETYYRLNRFEEADWHGQQRAQRERIEYYDLRVDEGAERLAWFAFDRARAFAQPGKWRTGRLEAVPACPGP